MPNLLEGREHFSALRRGVTEHQAMQGFLRALQPKTLQGLFREFSKIKVPVDRELSEQQQGTFDMTRALNEAFEIMKQAEKLQKQQPDRQNIGAERASQVAHSIASAMFLRMLRGELQPTKTAQQLINSGVAQQFQRQVPMAPLQAEPIREVTRF